MKDYLSLNLNEKEAKLLNPLVLAYIGDCVYELIIRSHILLNNQNMVAHKLHLKSVQHVKAKTQSEYMRKIESALSEEEQNIFKRGRNAKSGSVPKNANIVDYRVATGFEALFGYLYVSNQRERINELTDIILKK